MGLQTVHLVWFSLCHIFNFLDGVLTLAAISRGVEEANPIMAWALSVGPEFFLFIKFTIFAAASWYSGPLESCSRLCFYGTATSG